MTLDTTLATAVTGSGGEAGAGGWVTGEPVTCAAIIGETFVGPAARARASANTATLSGCLILVAGSANPSTGWADALALGFATDRDAPLSLLDFEADGGVETS
jgi:hypothetical protein